MWSVVGDLSYSGIPVRLTFEDGKLSGSKDGVQEAEDYADAFGFVGVTPTGPWVEADLSDEHAAFWVVSAILRHVTVVDGEIPEAPPPPENAPPDTVY